MVLTVEPSILEWSTPFSRRSATNGAFAAVVEDAVTTALTAKARRDCGDSGADELAQPQRRCGRRCRRRRC